MTKNEFLKRLSSALQIAEEDLNIDTRLSGVWDSIGQIGVLSMLEEEFNVNLEMDELVSIKTVQDVLDISKSRGVQFE